MVGVGPSVLHEHTPFAGSRRQLPRTWFTTHGAKAHDVQGRSASVGSGGGQVTVADGVETGVDGDGGVTIGDGVNVAHGVHSVTQPPELQ
jgi:hypothetical protein